MDTLVTFRDVEVTREADMGLFCLVAGREVFVGQLVRDASSSVRRKGDRGTLVVPKWFALQNGLPVR